MNSPFLSDEINSHIAKSEIEGGIKIDDLPAGKALQVQTRNTTYLIERRGDGLYISGNVKYCPSPTKCNIHGSTWGGSMLKIGFVGRGMHLEFSTEAHPQSIVTTEIQEITEKEST